jgi:hypothetical protein
VARSARGSVRGPRPADSPAPARRLPHQPWRAFRPDGVIFFSDILTPLPALGIEFDVIKGKGPVIADPLRSMDALRALRTLDDPSSSLKFTGETLSALRWGALGDSGVHRCLGVGVDEQSSTERVPGVQRAQLISLVPRVGPGAPWQQLQARANGAAPSCCSAAVPLTLGI